MDRYSLVLNAKVAENNGHSFNLNYSQASEPPRGAAVHESVKMSSPPFSTLELLNHIVSYYTDILIYSEAQKLITRK